MPKIFEIHGYKVYIWQNENGEPVHVHVQKGTPSANATKVWLLSNGGIVLDHNKSRINSSELSDILCQIRLNWGIIVNKWNEHHGYVSFIK